MIQSKAKLSEQVSIKDKVVKIQKTEDNASIPRPTPDSDTTPHNPAEQLSGTQPEGMQTLPHPTQVPAAVASKSGKHLIKEDEASDTLIGTDSTDLSSPSVDMGGPVQYSGGEIFLAQADATGGVAGVVTDTATQTAMPGAAADMAAPPMTMAEVGSWGFLGVVGAQAFSGSTAATAAAAPVVPVVAAPVGFALTGGIWLGKINSAVGLTIEAFKADGSKLAGTGKVNADGTFSIQVTENYSGPVLIRLKDTDSGTNYTDEGTGKPRDLSTDLRAVVNVSGHGGITVAITPLTELAVRELLGDSGGDAGTASTVLGQAVTTAHVTAANDSVKTAFHLSGDILTTAPVTVDDAAFANSTSTAAQKAYGHALAAISGAESSTVSTSDVLKALSQGLVGSQLTQSSVDLLIAGATKADTNFSTGAAAALTTAIGTGLKDVHLSNDTGTADDFITHTAVQTVTATLTSPLASNTLLWGSADGGSTWTAATVDVLTKTIVTLSGVTLAGDSSIKFAFTPDTVKVSADVAKAAVGTVSMQPYSLDVDAPVFADAPVSPAVSATASLAENSTAVAYKAVATDAHGISYSLSGTDASLFSINAASGAVTFVSSPDFESLTHVSNVYDINVLATDVAGNVKTQAVAITVTNVNEAPNALTSGATGSIAENATGAVYTAAGTDPDANTTLSYSIAGTDAALFNINSSTGAVTFKLAPNFEAPADAGGNNVYDITVKSSDGTLSSAAQAVAITVTNVNEAPVLTSAAAFNFAENASTAVYTVTASDQDAGTTLSYALAGADAALFNINSSSGAVTFKASPNFEAPGATGGGNVYHVDVTASDGTNTTAVQAVAITVTDVNEAPTSSAVTPSLVVINQPYALDLTSSFTDVDAGDHLTYAATGLPTGLTLNATTGVISGSVANTGVSHVSVTATDTASHPTAQSFDLTVIAQPVITSISTTSGPAKQGDALSFTVVMSEAVTVQGTPTLSLTVGGQTMTATYVSGSTTSSLVFTATASGGDSNAVSIASIDLAGGSVIGDLTTLAMLTNVVGQTVASFVIDNSNPVFSSSNSSSFAENATGVAYATAVTDATGLGYTLSGTDAAAFNINSATGAVSFKSAPDFEAPVHVNNVYDVSVTATDALGHATVQAVAITVTNVNEAPNALTSGAAGSIAENATGAVYTAAGTDPDANTTLSYSIAGTDASLFNIDRGTGAVTFKVAPNFEAPADAGHDNVYDITVTSSDGLLSSAAQAVAITVTNVNEAPVLTSGAAFNFAENASGTVYTVAATDQDAGTSLTYALAGADAGVFNIDSSSGAVTFKTSPNFEAPGANGGGNVYHVDVTASDSINSPVAQAVAITVTDVNEVPTSTAVTAPAVVVAHAYSFDLSSHFSDVDAADVHLTYSASGLPTGLFINADTGVISGSVQAEGHSTVTVTATDTAAHSTFQTFGVHAVVQPVISTVSASVALAKSGTTMILTVALSEAVDISSGTPTLDFSVGDQQMTATYVSGSGSTALLFSATAPLGDSLSVGLSAIHLNGATVQGQSSQQPLLTSAVGQTVNALVIDNTDPVFNSATTATFLENAGATAYVSAVTDTTTLTYSLGGADAGQFDISASTGAVNFKSPPNFEAAADAGTNNVYDVSVTATDALGHATVQAVAITVTNVNEAPNALTSGATGSIAENATGAVYTAAGTDPDANTTLSYSIAGTDAALFNIDHATGAVTFKVAPNFEAPADAGGNNVYDITVTSFDGALSSTAQAVAITVNNVNEAPLLTSAAAFNFAENASTAVYTVTATDQDAGTTLSYALAGADATLFNIDSSSGAVSFKASPNFEVPGANGGGNVYHVNVTASDGTNTTAAQAVAITVTDVNEVPTSTAVPAQAVVVAQAYSLDLSTHFTDVDAADVHLTYGATGLPTGLSIGIDTGIISGTVAGTSLSHVSVTATDTASHTTTQTFDLTALSAPTLTSHIDNVTNFEVTSNIVLTTTEQVTAVAGKSIHIVNDGGTGFHGESQITTQTIDVTDTAQITFANNTITINPGFDLDFGNNYHITIDAGAFLGASSGVSSVAVSDITAMNFSTVSPVALGTGAGVAASSQAMVSGTDALVAGHSWLDVEGSSAPSAAPVVLDMSTGNIAVAISDIGTVGIATNDFFVALNNFGSGDLIYFDNHGLNTQQRQAGLDDGMITADSVTGPTHLISAASAVPNVGTAGGQFDVAIANASVYFPDTATLKVLLGNVNYEPIVYG
jgi:hypothetical protein